MLVRVPCSDRRDGDPNFLGRQNGTAAWGQRSHPSAFRQIPFSRPRPARDLARNKRSHCSIQFCRAEAVPNLWPEHAGNPLPDRCRSAVVSGRALLRATASADEPDLRGRHPDLGSSSFFLAIVLTREAFPWTFPFGRLFRPIRLLTALLHAAWSVVLIRFGVKNLRKARHGTRSSLA